ncbi:cobyrinic acid a,c-diamide synthase [Antricoccus suffuscus]|uniref:Hydrogenobyrinate a,c-diamide synthase n=1 Tax=Antricoccus suffuscus TaxID=1629062 RepID=A0A2T0ZZG0_9ACTN|nr:cobyrinate a,c-diamide synthase [Antricoccus suffuscus]PRZ41741.1 cobyrinic acid a,c-diamide synthase [Antricoccus suffuscus]
MVSTLPRVVIAAPASGHGKTTVATGLMAALRRNGRTVAPFKIGPDYIDPGYHALATGVPGRNLDPHLTSPEQLVPLLLHGAATPRRADIAVIEGVMGLYDGSIGGDGFASTAHVADLIGAPVILVVDISAASRSVAATVHGMATFDPRVHIAGVILNKSGSARHSGEVIEAMAQTGIPVLGVLNRDDGISAPSRHLGLVPAAERDEAAASIDRLAAQIAANLDVDEIARIAANAADLAGKPWSPASVVSPPSDLRPIVAVAGGRAFTFRYAEAEELLVAAGCEPVIFDPTRDTSLPEGTAGIYLGGGFPEIHAAALSANLPLRQAIAAAVAAGTPTVAECAGLLYLCREVDGSPMSGALDAAGSMTPRLTLSYRTAIAAQDTLVARAGERVSGHEFHRTQVDPPMADGRSAWLLDGAPAGFSTDPAGTGTPTLHASYLHTHWAGHPRMAQRFADAMHRFAATSPATTSQESVPSTAVSPAPAVVEPDAVDLHHHGDQEIGEGLVDFAVNVRLDAPPDWLAQVVNSATASLAAYPRASAASEALAQRHCRHLSEVLPTSGGAEAFTLLARALPRHQAVVVHPQFTEPETALRAAGHEVTRVLLSANDGFALRPGLIPDDASSVFIGNPTNPTGTLHRADLLRAIARPGRTVVVDEAFMDAVPGEQQSLVQRSMPGLVVIRSLTKTWGIAGLRAGYAVGDAAVISLMAAQQPTWSVSTPALEAIVACSEPRAVDAAESAAALNVRNRQILVDGLTELGIAVAGNPQTPFVLADASAVKPVRAAEGWLRRELRDAGFAVRRCDTFPGLHADWVRIAVRAPALSRRLLHAVAAQTGRAHYLQGAS